LPGASARAAGAGPFHVDLRKNFRFRKGLAYQRFRKAGPTILMKNFLRAKNGPVF
jgi:hypothetical protein